MSIQYGIAGFVIGLMMGLLVGLIELKLCMRLQVDTATPFIIGFTVLACAFAGVVIGVKRAKKA